MVKKYSCFIVLMVLTSFVLVACGSVEVTSPSPPQETLPAQSSSPASPSPTAPPSIPYVVVNDDIGTCFISPGPNTARYGVDPIALVHKGESYHVFEVTSQDAATHPPNAWFRIDNPEDPGSACWLPANGVRLVGDLSSIQSAAIPPTPTWTGRSPFLEPRIGDIHCWFGPAETWGIAGTVKAGVRIEITSLLEGGEWFQIGNPDRPGTHCWARWLDVLVYNDLSQLPVMAVDDFPSIMAIDAGVNCRTNPSRDADIVGALIPETAVPIVAVLGDSSWWLIENPDNPGTVCWVSGTVTKVSGDVSKIPVIPITP